MDFDQAKLMAIACAEPLEKSDAIICLEGDGQIRTQKASELFKENWAPIILVSGGADSSPFGVPAKRMADYLLKKNVPKNNIIIEGISKNTREQAVEVTKIVTVKKWKKIILVASNFHQLRAFLTFLKAMQELNMKIKIFNAPANAHWFSKTKTGISRIKLLDKEFKKINEYEKKGHLVSMKEALLYQKWKEENI